ncbi:hypothetical protein VAE130_570272 [Vibrio aestuarianus]|nr:hypothetical protein VAE128_460272 [Vibrio aestuarianus]CAH8194632.1 hypothetical protein VAE130_570272 [Vibrio aestuarianus]
MTPIFSANLSASALNSGACLIRVFLVVIVHLVSDCTHLTQCPKLLVRISYTFPMYRKSDNFCFFVGIFLHDMTGGL